MATRKYWRKNDESAVVSISESKEGEEKALKAGLHRVALKDMTSYQRKCVRDYDENNPTAFPATYLG